jgi:hypothetical protein
MADQRPPVQPGAHGHIRAAQPSTLIDPLVDNAHAAPAGRGSLEVVETEGRANVKSYEEVPKHRHHDWKRVPTNSGQGPVRMKSFHGKYSDQGLAYLDDAVNEWLDNHPEVEVKFVTSTVGLFEGKMREPALVLNVWY